jgi:hypothetical protein
MIMVLYVTALINWNVKIEWQSLRACVCHASARGCNTFDVSSIFYSPYDNSSHMYFLISTLPICVEYLYMLLAFIYFFTPNSGIKRNVVIVIKCIVDIVLNDFIIELICTVRSIINGSDWKITTANLNLKLSYPHSLSNVDNFPTIYSIIIHCNICRLSTQISSLYFWCVATITYYFVPKYKTILKKFLALFYKSFSKFQRH